MLHPRDATRIEPVRVLAVDLSDGCLTAVFCQPVDAGADAVVLRGEVFASFLASSLRLPRRRSDGAQIGVP